MSVADVCAGSTADSGCECSVTLQVNCLERVMPSWSLLRALFLPSNQIHHDHNERNYDQNVNESPDGSGCEHTKEPQDNKYRRNDPQHRFPPYLTRSGLRSFLCFFGNGGSYPVYVFFHALQACRYPVFQHFRLFVGVFCHFSNFLPDL